MNASNLLFGLCQASTLLAGFILLPDGLDLGGRPTSTVRLRRADIGFDSLSSPEPEMRRCGGGGSRH